MDPAQMLLRHQLTDSPRVAPPDHTYASPQDFVLQHGKWYKPRVMAKMPPRLCFASSVHIALVYGWTYVEGYALNPLIRMPIHHAWVVDHEGRPVEVAWRPFAGLAYLGVELSPLRAEDAAWEGDGAVLADPKRDWPILREPWQGETWIAPQCERVRLMKKVLPLMGMFQAAGLPKPPMEGTDPALLRRWEAAIRRQGRSLGPEGFMDALIEASKA